MAIPAIPQNLAVQQANGQVFISCDQVAGATSYQVQRSLDNVSFSVIASPAVPHYLDTAVTQGTQYFYKIASTNGDGTSSYTLSQSVVPAQSGLLSLGELRLLARQRADRVNSNFVTNPEINTYINQSMYELYDILTTVYEDYNVYGPVLFQTNGTDFQFPLPNGILTFQTQTGSSVVPPPFYKLLGVDCGIALNTNAWVTLRKFDFIDRNNYVFPNVTSSYLGVFNLRYRLLGSNLSFIPTPSAGQYLRMWYVPRLTELLKDNDLCDGISGWTEYLIVDAAIKILQKEESDVSVLLAQKQALIDRIQSSSMNRDAGMPDTISDIRSHSAQWGNYGPPGGSGSYGGY